MKIKTRLLLKAAVVFAVSFLTVSVPMFMVVTWLCLKITDRPVVIVTVFMGSPVVLALFCFVSALMCWKEKTERTLAGIVTGYAFLSFNLIRLNEEELKLLK